MGDALVIRSSSSTVTASLLIDHCGRFRMDQHPMNLWRGIGAALLVGGVVLISKL